MTQPKLFISYRRSDAIDAVRALYFHLRLRFGISQVFMDVSAIGPGDVWPERLKCALSEASIVLVVMGPTWLTAADPYGRRRIDIKGDWVGLEVKGALDQGKTIIPLLIGGVRDLPPAEALPAALKGLLNHQQTVVHDTSWEHDVQALSQRLVDHHGFKPSDEKVAYPLPEKTTEPVLTQAQLFAALQSLPRWEPVETAIPRDYPHSRHELRRGFRFQKFKHAIEFLQCLVEPLNQLKHHPRIENQWRTVFIHFTTWDVGNRITALDIEAARKVDALHQAFMDALADKEP